MKTQEKSETKLDEEKTVIEICPLCGSLMEKGFYIVPRQTWWDTKKHKWFWGGDEINPFKWTLTSFESSRCKRCKLIAFKYGESDNHQCSITQCF